jgi:hypothetical protein
MINKGKGVPPQAVDEEQRVEAQSIAANEQGESLADSLAMAQSERAAASFHFLRKLAIICFSVAGILLAIVWGIFLRQFWRVACGGVRVANADFWEAANNLLIVVFAAPHILLVAAIFAFARAFAPSANDKETPPLGLPIVRPFSEG